LQKMISRAHRIPSEDLHPHYLLIDLTAQDKQDLLMQLVSY